MPKSWMQLRSLDDWKEVFLFTKCVEKVFISDMTTYAGLKEVRLNNRPYHV